MDKEKAKNKRTGGRTKTAGSGKNVAGGRTKTAGSGTGEKQVWPAGNMLYPLPVVMVSCARPGEQPNIITLAWAGTVCTNPPMVSISVRPGRYSHAILEESGEFVINLVTEDLIRACDWCGVRSGREHDKFARCGLTAAAAQKLTSAPLIKESPVNIECRIVKKESLGSHDLFLASVECVHADSAFLDENGRFDLSKAQLVTYSHGEYFALGKKLGSFGYSVKKPAKTPRRPETADRMEDAGKSSAEAGRRAEAEKTGKSIRDNRKERKRKPERV